MTNKVTFLRVFYFTTQLLLHLVTTVLSVEETTKDRSILVNIHSIIVGYHTSFCAPVLAYGVIRAAILPAIYPW